MRRAIGVAMRRARSVTEAPDDTIGATRQAGGSVRNPMRKTRWLNVSFAENLKISRCIGRRDYDTAIQLIRRGLNNSKQDAQGLHMIAMCHCSAGQDEAAIRAADQALAYDPQCFGAIQTLVRVYVKRQQHDMAARYVRLGLEHFPAPLPEPPR